MCGWIQRGDHLYIQRTLLGGVRDVLSNSRVRLLIALAGWQVSTTLRKQCRVQNGRINHSTRTTVRSYEGVTKIMSK